MLVGDVRTQQRGHVFRQAQPTTTSTAGTYLSYLPGTSGKFLGHFVKGRSSAFLNGVVSFLLRWKVEGGRRKVEGVPITQ